MKQIGWFLLASFLLSGCATTTAARSKESEHGVLTARLDTLERDLAALNQRMDQVAIPQPQSQLPAAASSSIPGSTPTQKRLAVRQIQQALTAAGYYKGPVDGKEGPQTKQAIRQFQKDKGLKADGVVGRETTEAIVAYLPESKGR